MKYDTKKPPRLKEGDTIGIVACSSPDPVNFKEKFENGLNVIKELGFKVKLGENVFRMRDYMAGTERERAEDINRMFEDTSINAIICAGGGASANRVLPYLDYALIRKNPKIFMGISNPSILTNAIYSQTGVITFNGPTVAWDFGGENGFSKYTKEYMYRALVNKDPIGRIEPTAEWEVLKKGSARGKLICGHLSTIQSLVGVKYSPDWSNRIFLWEEVGKPISRIDNILTHFKLAGIFDKISGMVIGEPVDCGEKECHESLEIKDVVLDLCKDYDFPILYGVKFGHTPEKITIPIGVPASLELAEDEFIFSIDESGVK